MMTTIIIRRRGGDTGNDFKEMQKVSTWEDENHCSSNNGQAIFIDQLQAWADW